MVLKVQNNSILLNDQVVDILTTEDGYYKSGFHKFYFRSISSLLAHWEMYLEERRGAS